MSLIRNLDQVKTSDSETSGALWRIEVVEKNSVLSIIFRISLGNLTQKRLKRDSTFRYH